MEISPEVNLLLEQSRSLEISGDFPQALCKAQQALELAQSHGDEEGTARALTYLGIIHFRLGNYSTSRAFAQQSLNHADSNPRSRAETLLLLGTLAMEEDSLDDMEMYCLQAADYCRSIGFEDGRFRALHNLSQVYSLRGQFDLLMAADEEAYRIACKLNLPQQAIPLISMIFVYIRTRQAARAEALLKLLEQKIGASRLFKGYHELLQGMLGLLLEDYPGAIAHFTESHSIAEELGDPALQIFLRMGISRYHRLTGKDWAALEWAEDGVAWASRHRNRRMLGRTLIERGYAYWKVGNVAAARADLEAAIQELGERQQWYDQSYARLLLAALLDAEGDPLAVAAWQEAAEQILSHGYTHLLDQERTLTFPMIANFLDHPDKAISNLSARCIEELEKVPAPPLFIRALGGFEVRRGGRQIPARVWRQRKAGELMCLLLISPRRCLFREQILEAIWPNKPSISANALLHQTTSVLRRILEPELPERFPSRYLQVEDRQISLTLPPGSWFDVEQFEQEIKAENWQAAVDLYRGVLYPQDLYAAWAEPYRHYLENLYLRALYVLAHRNYSEGKARETIDLCMKILEKDPCQEEAVLLAMQAHLIFNDRAAAIRLYQQLERVLWDDLRVRPQARLQALYESLKQTPL
ncbi:MAG: Transcriptional regulator [Anaerolineae bacterium]|nr:MAG: Transcriptional regulator [Anaerolineae bacterium]